MKEKKRRMTMQELSTLFQQLCNDGWSQHEVLFWQKDLEFLFPEELELRIKSDVSAGGFITVKFGA